MTSESGGWFCGVIEAPLKKAFTLREKMIVDGYHFCFLDGVALFRQQIAISTCNVCTQGGVVSSSIPEEIMSIHLMSPFFILRLTWPRKAQTVYQYHANRASTWCTYTYNVI
jgi:hypothetical protein